MPKTRRNEGEGASARDRQEDAEALRVIGNDLEDWEAVKPGTTFRTAFGARYKRLLCGHFRKLENVGDSGIGENVERDPNFCWEGCHERTE